MKIISSVFENNQNIPSKYTCDGDPPAGGVNPPLEFIDAPPSASSLVLIVDDPDAPRPPAGGWVHWLLWNIPPTTSSIPENSVPSSAVQGTTDFGNQKYGGPCPPSGTHRYFFKLYALDRMLNIPPSSTKKDLLAAMQNHIIEKTELIGLYQRP